VVAAPPFVGLMTRTGPAFMSYAVAGRPGEPVRELGDSLETLRAEFAPNEVRFELIEEASPGAVDALRAAGVAETGRFPVLTLDTAELIIPKDVERATVLVSKTKQDANHAQRVASTAFESELGDEVDAPGDPAGGGSVLARIGDRAVATAFWTAVEDGVTEIAGVATLPWFRNRGLGAVVTAAAVVAARDLAGASLAWMTPGHDSADRIYRRAGFAPTATAVHLVASQPSG